MCDCVVCIPVDLLVSFSFVRARARSLSLSLSYVWADIFIRCGCVCLEFSNGKMILLKTIFKVGVINGYIML